MRFKKVYIEITNACNLHCPFCSSAKRLQQFMNTEDFAYILDEIAPFCKFIYLHVLGEPLLHPSFPKLLRIAHEKGFYVNLTTNETLLPKQYTHIAEYVRQVNLSLHADLNGQFPDYLTDCLYYGDILAQQGVYISYRFWNRKHKEFDQATKQMLKVIADHYNVRIDMQSRQKLAERRFLHMEEQFTWPSLSHSPLAVNGSCYGMRRQCAILCDGSVVPCCLDAAGACCLGNIFAESFASILEKEKTKQITDGFQQGKIVDPLCQRCSYRMRFN